MVGLKIEIYIIASPIYIIFQSFCSMFITPICVDCWFLKDDIFFETKPSKSLFRISFNWNDGSYCTPFFLTLPPSILRWAPRAFHCSRIFHNLDPWLWNTYRSCWHDGSRMFRERYHKISTSCPSFEALQRATTEIDGDRSTPQAR